MQISLTTSKLCAAVCLAILATQPVSAAATPAEAPQRSEAGTAMPSHLAIVLERNAEAAGKGVESNKPTRISLTVPTDGSDTPFRDLTTAESPLEYECSPTSQMSAARPPNPPLELGLVLSVVVVEAGHSGAILQIRGRQSWIVAVDTLKVSEACQMKIPRISTDNFEVTTHLPLGGTPIQLNKAWSARATAL